MQQDLMFNCDFINDNVCGDKRLLGLDEDLLLPYKVTFSSPLDPNKGRDPAHAHFSTLAPDTKFLRVASCHVKETKVVDLRA